MWSSIPGTNIATNTGHEYQTNKLNYSLNIGNSSIDHGINNLDSKRVATQSPHAVKVSDDVLHATNYVSYRINKLD